MVDRATISVAESLFLGATLYHPSPSVLPLWVCAKGFCATPVCNMSDLTVGKCVQLIHLVQPVKTPMYRLTSCSVFYTVVHATTHTVSILSCVAVHFFILTFLKSKFTGWKAAG